MPCVTGTDYLEQILHTCTKREAVIICEKHFRKECRNSIREGGHVTVANSNIKCRADHAFIELLQYKAVGYAMLRYAPAGASDFESDSEDGVEFYDPNSGNKDETIFDNVGSRSRNPTEDIQSAEFSPVSETGNTEEKDPKVPDLVLYDVQTAIIRGNYEVVRHFIEKLHNPNVLLNSGWTCLMYASYFFQPKIIELLLECEADVDITNTDGKTALHLACHSTSNLNFVAQMECLEILISVGANIHVVDNSGKTPLMYSVRGQNHGILDVLLQNPAKGIFLNLKDQNDFTALDWSAIWDNTTAIKKLLNAGAEALASSSPSHKLWSDRVRECFGEKETEGNSDLCADEKLLDDDKPNVSLALEAREYCKDNKNSKHHGEEMSEIQLSDILPLLIEEKSIKDNEYETYGQLELFLLGLGLPHAIEIFKEQDITFHQLLCLTMEELEYIGIKGLGTRKRILKAACDCHMKNENSNKMTDFTSEILTFDNTLKILVRVAEQTKNVACSLRYIKQHIEMYPNLIQPASNVKYDQLPVMSLKENLDDILTSVHEMNKSFRSLQNQVAQSEKCYTKTELTPSDFVVITSQPDKMERVKTIFFVVLSAVGIVVSFLPRISTRLLK